MFNSRTIAVVIPSYKVTKHILDVINTMPAYVDHIIIIDDCCPEQSGDFVRAHCNDPRVRILKHTVNRGVGGAVLSGYKEAMDLRADIVVKVDGDGQMRPEIMHHFIKPIAAGLCDYTKGNRFFSPSGVDSMPTVRKLGNAGLSFMTKVSSGYWHIMDPTNGYTAISTQILNQLDFGKIQNRYFFESDMLFRLGTINAVVKDIPMVAVYGDEVSNLKIGNSLVTFLKGNVIRTFKRLAYHYFIRDFNLGSLYFLFSLPLLLISTCFGIYRWNLSVQTNTLTPAGTLFLVALPFIVGVQLFLNFLSYDVISVPNEPLTNWSDSDENTFQKR